MRITKHILPDTFSGPPGITAGFPIDPAAWIWHPDLSAPQPAFLRFTLTFSVQDGDPPLRLHLSCDQYAEASLDGLLFFRGPEASPVDACSFASFDIAGLLPGPHHLSVFAWWLGTGRLHAPLARETLAPGFILAAEAPFTERLSTGSAPWQVAWLRSYAIDTDRVFPPAFGIGGGLRLDTRDPSRHCPGALPAAVVHPPLTSSHYGERRPRFRLRPARLPEQLLRPDSPGRVRALRSSFMEVNGPEPPPCIFQTPDLEHPDIPQWQSLWTEARALTLAPRQERSVLIDLDTYLCGFPEIEVCGGADAEIVWDWAESLWIPGTNRKGHRDDIPGKSFRGFSDTFFCNGDALQLRPHWWRAGRYCLLRIRTAEQPLTLQRLRILETRYPLQVTGSFSCDQDADLAPVQAICRRGLEMCMHESYMDCPHYEQLMYVFDTRLEILSTYAISPDDRLPRRAIELYDLSRSRFDGFTCSRFPCFEDQLIPLFSLCWTWMLRDYLYWRDDPDWLRRFLPGARHIHDAFARYENADGLLEALPGWNYGDWVTAWPAGGLPSAARGVSSILNLIYVHSLQQLADLELHLGDPGRAPLLHHKAACIQRELRRRFLDPVRGVFRDDDHGHLSQHAQIWAILSQTLSGPEAARALHSALADPAFAPASYMQRSHLFDALAAIGDGGRILTELEAWRKMVDLGALTGFEHDEPTRSDCHAWSSHPLYHLPCTLLGIRPAAPGFASVRIAPQPGTFKSASTVLPHPRGDIRAELRFYGDRCEGRIKLPYTVNGTFLWNGNDLTLNPGWNSIALL